MRRVLLVVLMIAAAAGCAPKRVPAQPSSPRPALELLGEYDIAPLSTFDGLKAARFGGISGLAVDPRTNEVLGICDDRVDSRVFVFRPIEPGATPFTVQLHAYFPLPQAEGAPARLDPEAIAITRGGRLFISSEGIENEEPRIPPAIVEYTRRADFVRQITLPSKFIPPATGAITRGVRDNAAFESLALTPDERHLFTATETALAQDGEPADATRGTLARMIEFEAEGDTFAARREFAYPIDPLGALDFTPGFFINGLVELVALSDTGFLSMERGYAEEPGANGRRVNRIRIFYVSIEGATDISQFDSIRGRLGLRTARKRLLFALSTVKGLSPALAELDNFEGMTFGPTLPDGARTLLLVSDDNFSARQRTSFLLFRINVELNR